MKSPNDNTKITAASHPSANVWGHAPELESEHKLLLKRSLQQLQRLVFR